MNAGIRTFSRILTILFSVALVFFWIYLQFSGSREQNINYLFNLLVAVLYLFVGLLAIPLTRNGIKSSMYSFLLLYGGAFISWAMASFIWAYFNFILHTDVPYPSIADIFYILFTVLLGWSLWFYFDIFHAKITRNSIRDSFFIIIGVYFVIFFVLYQPKYELGTPLLEVILNYLYPLLDATVLSLAFVTLRLEIKEEVPNTLFIVIAILSQVAGDILFSFRVSNRTYWNGDISDLFFLLTAIFSFIGIMKVKKGYENLLEIRNKEK